MLSSFIFKAAVLAAILSAANGAAVSSASSKTPTAISPRKVAHESVGTNPQIAIRQAASPVAPVVTQINGLTVTSNTSVVAAAAAPASNTVIVTTVSSTVLVFARDSASGYSAFSGLNGYAIPYQLVVVPQAGIILPGLNSSATVGNYGAIVILSEVSYDYGGTTGFQSAITAAQWAILYQYQVSFGVRMVRLDVFPSADSGTSTIGGCCATGEEQTISISNATGFPTAGLITGAALSTLGLWHYPATITNSSIATEFAQFTPSTGFPTTSTAGVLNNIGGRQQMVFFTSFATDWSLTSNYLQHAWIHWATRGLYTGYRRAYLNTQIDDMFLESAIYSPTNTTYQVTTTDLDQHVTWMTSVNKRLPAGSNWFMEICHNGNGNIEDASNIDQTGTKCGIGPIEYPDQIDTPLEWAKPIGTGVNLWPSTPLTYPYTTTCTNLDALKKWWAELRNLNSFAHVSHTFTHEDQNNATYFDVYQELTWNQAWLKQVGIAGATRFSPKGLVPPAITGLHNGDAIRAWIAAGIVNVVGDNTRPVLMNSVNEMWPLMTTVALNGYDGVQITPRWATNIYYNCQLPDCTVAEWINTNVGVPATNTWYDLLALEKATNTRHLLGLHHDPFMFHQANLNYVTAGTTTINGVSSKLSMFQAWVEIVIQEMTRLVTWPILSLKHDDIATAFATRMARDACAPMVTFTTDPTVMTITGLTLTTNANTCNNPIPVTVPGTVTSTQGFTTEKIGNDPLTIWVTMSGSPVTFTLSTPIPL
ncbi:hypothetical protein DL95DRAFT_370457 [Leptodontidium sp. 2 PMI_412]|nr:hypothetical protein DL95DRAFT_370457 [Leptodontidium sp. 2 PMI_412]